MSVSDKDSTSLYLPSSLDLSNLVQNIDIQSSPGSKIHLECNCLNSQTPSGSWSLGKDSQSRPQKANCECYTNYSQTIRALEKDLQTAAEVGHALLIRHQEYVETTTKEKSEMKRDIDQLNDHLTLINAQNKSMFDNNASLINQLGDLNEALTLSDTRVDLLSSELEKSRLEVSKLGNFTARSEALESQISMLERIREDLQQELSVANRDKEDATNRWRETEKLLDKLIFQYERLEKDSGRTPISADTAPATSNVQKFIKKIINDNVRLEVLKIKLQTELSESKVQMGDLRNIITSGDTSQTSSSVDQSKGEIHYHNHYHIAPVNTTTPTNIKPRSKSHSRFIDRKLSTPARLNSGILSPPSSGISNLTTHGVIYSRSESFLRSPSLPQHASFDPDASESYDYDDYYEDEDAVNSLIRKSRSHESIYDDAPNVGNLHIHRSLSPPKPFLYKGTTTFVEDEESVQSSQRSTLYRSTSHESVLSALTEYTDMQSMTSRSYLYGASHNVLMNSRKASRSHAYAETTFASPTAHGSLSRTPSSSSRMLLSQAVSSSRRKSSHSSLNSASSQTNLRSVRAPISELRDPTANLVGGKPWKSFFMRFKSSDTPLTPESPPRNAPPSDLAPPMFNLRSKPVTSTPICEDSLTEALQS